MTIGGICGHIFRLPHAKGNALILPGLTPEGRTGYYRASLPARILHQGIIARPRLRMLPAHLSAYSLDSARIWSIFLCIAKNVALQQSDFLYVSLGGPALNQPLAQITAICSISCTSS